VLKLQPPDILGGRVVDSAGRRLARATLSFQSWPGSESLEQEMTADSDGRFLWNDAPGDEVRVRIYAKGFVQSRGIPVFPCAQNQIVMASPTTVKGTVVDAETGRPISNFSLVEGTVWKVGNSLIWQRNGAVDEHANKTPGSFELTFGHQVHQRRVRVEADGYFPEDSGLVAQDGSLHEFSCRLTKADRIRSTVINHDARRRFLGPKLLLAPTRVLPPPTTRPRSQRRFRSVPMAKSWRRIFVAGK
jgi:hypothetical protein